MSKQRADLGFSDALDEFNPAEWSPKPAGETKPKPADTKAMEAMGFRSREPKQVMADAPGKTQRRRRTGRNAQFNLKARPETIEAYCAIADRQGWGLGETLERAVELLEREYRN
ncbi:stability/partitioning determinant [Jiella marina]|uniref:stability/partitioning determinant n=1 Tax=Jiella sp. LLJ827 TaxID=2917712 RepID=UPI002101101C|nr:stability/partitioning determinant [Jiella sp. LLJ827]MCQ0990599.1 stability/partitioning determinant [Jiella sp. LLJ827]